MLPSQGFGELGDAGRERQQRLASFAGPGGLRIVGPNTDGVANLASGAIASIQPLFLRDRRAPRRRRRRHAERRHGRVADGAAPSRGDRLPLYASAGNEADLGLADFLSVVVQDPEIDLVLSFVEAVRRPADFLAWRRAPPSSRQADRPDQDRALGSGGAAAAGHTGALAGSDECYDALFRDYGVIRAGELGELVAIAKLFLARGAPRSRGVGIMSVSGGQAGALADQAARNRPCRAAALARGRGRDRRDARVRERFQPL